MKTIETLIKDIEEVLTQKVGTFPEGSVERFADNLSSLVKDRLTKKEDVVRGLRMSNIGSPCERKLWYSINKPEHEEPLRAETLLKFLYGDMLEELLLFLTEVAGHKVEGRQDTQIIAGVEGHRDAVIDGVTVDVKSASTFSFAKFKNHKLEEDDPFGYKEQLQSYVHAGQTDDVVTDKKRGAFLVMDKQHGHLCLDIHDYKPKNFEELYEQKKTVVARESPPRRGIPVEPDGKSGNMKLGTVCSYCSFKETCWPGLRTFLYSSGPRFLTIVENEPMVPELK